MDAGLGGGVAHDTDGLARSFARARIGLRALTADGQTAQVADTSVALDALEALQIYADFPPEITLDNVLSILNRVNDLRELLLGQILGANAGIDIRSGEDLSRVGRPNAINVTQRDLDAFVRRYFYPNYSCHISESHGMVEWWSDGVRPHASTPILQYSNTPFHVLPLSLLVARVGTDHADDAFAPNDFAIFAKLFNRCANFHVCKLSSFSTMMRPSDKS